MRRLIGLAMVVCGLAVAGLGCYPWILVKFMRPGRFHYYYIADAARDRMLTFLMLGAVMIAVGIVFALAPTSPPRDP
ncbi:MAG: hypothetical protein ACHQ50_16995 [Fimbriimonadales bacterium]